GSLRRKSLNTLLIRRLAEITPENIDIELAKLHDIPFYDGDVESESGIPTSVEALRERIKAADGLILAMPEYNGGMPGVLKNALDWLTRPPKEMGPTFAGRPLALAGATPGGLGTALAQAGSLTVLRQLKVRLFPDHLRISSATDRLNEQGQPDEKLAKQLQRWLDGYIEFIQS
ncbi:MAG: NAD(P)H-dependent oxidoreductase, partial [Pseudomonadota bacterium]